MTQLSQSTSDTHAYLKLPDIECLALFAALVPIETDQPISETIRTKSSAFFEEWLLRRRQTDLFDAEFYKKRAEKAADQLCEAFEDAPDGLTETCINISHACGSFNRLALNKRRAGKIASTFNVLSAISAGLAYGTWDQGLPGYISGLFALHSAFSGGLSIRRVRQVNRFDKKQAEALEAIDQNSVALFKAAGFSDIESESLLPEPLQN